MRLANVNGRATLLLVDDAGVDVHAASDGRFGPELPAVYGTWAEFADWAQQADLESSSSVTFERSELGSPSPAPRQVFAIGLNYAEHAQESGFATPDSLPPVFTKFVSSITGPDTAVSLPPHGNTDWEVELTAVVGAEAHHVNAEDAWSYVAGLTIAQDISERATQLAGPAPQFSLGKSYPGFTPVGPWLVTPDEFSDPADIALGASVNGEVVQSARTSMLLFSVAELIAALSKIVTFYPGDLILTGTPAGVGMGRDPQRFLQPGDELVSWVEGIGQLRQTFHAANAS